MDVLFLIRDREAASARYRALQYLPYLERAGVRTQIEEIPPGWLARRRAFRRVARFDAVLLQKRLLPRSTLSILRRHAKRLVYDFDDAVLYHSSSKGAGRSLARWWRFQKVCCLADCVIAGNCYLRRLAERYARNVRVIPTTLDPRKYEQASCVAVRDDGHVTLGWIGSRSTLRYLQSIGGVLADIGKRCPTARLKIVCDEFPDIRGISVKRKVWRKEEEAADVASFDIGIAPSGYDHWSQGKCGLKVLQYLAASLPVVCTPVGVHRDMVKEGVNGFSANTTAEWTERISRLIASPEDRARMGAAGRSILEERYTLAAAAPRFTEAVLGSPSPS